MITKKQIIADLGMTCRTCLNRKYHLRLETKDCMYMRYLHLCPMCGEVKHIVQDISRTAGLKLLSGRAPGKSEKKSGGGVNLFPSRSTSLNEWLHPQRKIAGTPVRKGVAA